jgi:hypothetical protein
MNSVGTESPPEIDYPDSDGQLASYVELAQQRMAAEQEAERLRAKLRSLGANPD